MKTLKLLHPEWQGCGKNNRVAGGAVTVCNAFSRSGFVEVGVLSEEDLRVEGGILGRASIIKNSSQVAERLALEQPGRVFMVGGTCGSGLVPVAYLNQRYQGDLTVVWFDAHGDLNTPETSPSGHFHGMVLRTLLGEGDPSLLGFVPYPLSSSQLILSGVRDLDAAEAEYVSAENMTILSPDDWADSSSTISAVERSGSSHLYIHLDLDFFNPIDFKGSHFPVPGGISTDQFVPVLSALNSRFTVVGINVVEFASTSPDMAGIIPALFEKSGVTWIYD